MEKKKYYLGLDIGTDSVGYAATDEAYSLLRFHGESAWGVQLFDSASLSKDRRVFRVGRRRIDRRQQRVQLVQEIFAHEIAKKDVRFFQRIAAGRLDRSDTDCPFTLFADNDYTDQDYHRQYPTIHHLIVDLMQNDTPHDVRLVYLACAWLVAHRGHFLSEVSKENISALTDFHDSWDALNHYLEAQNVDTVIPWREINESEIERVLKTKTGVNAKYKQLSSLLFTNKKPPKPTNEFPYDCEQMLKAICGGTIKAATLFVNPAYDDIPSFSLGSNDDTLADVCSKIGDDAELLVKLKAIYDWALLVDILDGNETISAAKVHVYEQHENDLRLLKKMIRKYAPERYAQLFRELVDNNYVSYSGHCKKSQKSGLKKTGKDNFSQYVLGIIKGISPDPEDEKTLEDIRKRLEERRFLPKQRDTDNRVIPYQLYWCELNTLLSNAEKYLSFLTQKDENGISGTEKILSVFTFRIPYYVGPLNASSDFAWIVRKGEGRILPWNFDRMVDLDACEQAFIKRMTNTCTYLPYASVLPKESLIYHRFSVLNEINNIKIDGVPITVEAKQSVFQHLYKNRRKVTRRQLQDYLLSNHYMALGQTLSGIDEQLHSNLSPYHDFKYYLDSGVLSEEQVEHIIERITVTEDKLRLRKWLTAEYPMLSERNVAEIARLNYKDFGRLSKDLLTEITVTAPDGSNSYSILQAMWDTNCNLMELLSDNYEFGEIIRQAQREYYDAHSKLLTERMEEMHLSNAVKRPVLRALDITAEVVKAFGAPPQKIFVEMARGASPDQKNKRTKTRKQQLLELYRSCKEEDARILEQQIEAMGDTADNQLQGDRLFLYYLQLGRCMYTGQALDLKQIKGSAYNIEHIYPRKQVKDDSIINNEILVLSEVNGQKSDTYPISADIRGTMRPFWEKLKSSGLLSDEKFKRLTRSTPFTSDEKMGFIQRQLTETTQSTKAVAELLRERYPQTEIVYVKARLTSEFRQQFGCLKSRAYNDLHHAKDAYLNIVTGNVYDMKFSKRWFDVNSDYNIKTEMLFTHPIICNGQTVWDGLPMLDKVKKTLAKNNAHLTKYAYRKSGGYFDQMPVKAAPGLIPLKAGLPTEKYGGYNKPAISFFIPVHYRAGKKEETLIMSVELLHSQRFLADESYAPEYAKLHIEKIIGKKVDYISFPMGMRIWKTNTMLSIDGFKVLISSSSDYGTRLTVTPFMPFVASPAEEYYLKKVEVLVEKLAKNKNYIYDEKYDVINAEENLRLYSLYLSKLEKTVYSKRPTNPIAILKKGKERFAALSVPDQARALLNIHQIFGRISGGCDLTLIGGDSNAAAPKIRSNVSNWHKKYSDVRLIDPSASGLWEKRSENLLELL